MEVRKIDPAQMKKRPWIAKALAVNHLFVVEVGDKGWSAEATTVDGTALTGSSGLGGGETGESVDFG